MRLVRPEDVLLGVERLLDGNGKSASDDHWPMLVTV
jgi:hypothetical protein